MVTHEEREELGVREPIVLLSLGVQSLTHSKR